MNSLSKLHAAAGVRRYNRPMYDDDVEAGTDPSLGFFFGVCVRMKKEKRGSREEKFVKYRISKLVKRDRTRPPSSFPRALAKRSQWRLYTEAWSVR